MKRNNHHAPFGPQQRKTIVEKTFQLIELLIHGDAQRLKHLGRRMVVAAPAAFDSFNQARQFIGALDGPELSFGGDPLGDAPGLRLLAVRREIFASAHRLWPC